MANDHAPRRRGGQPGNRNAVKSGRYSRQVRTPEVGEIASREPGSATQEVAMLRIEARKLIERAREAATLNQRMEMLRILVVTALAIDHLLRRPPQRYERNVRKLIEDFMQELEKGG